MRIEVQDEEQYTLIRPLAGPLTDEIFDRLQQIVTDKLESDTRNFVIDLEWAGEPDRSQIVSFDVLNQIIAKERGALVVVSRSHELKDSFEEAAIITTPTLDEAVDYIFMEEIQRQLMEDEGLEGFDDRE